MRPMRYSFHLRKYFKQKYIMIHYTFSMSIRMSLWDGLDMYVNQLKVKTFQNSGLNGTDRGGIIAVTLQIS